MTRENNCIMKVLSYYCESLNELELSLQQEVVRELKPTLAIIFSATQHSIQYIQQIFNQHHIALFGMTSAGEIVDGTIYNGGISIMLLKIAKVNFNIQLQQITDSTYEAGNYLGYLANDLFEKPGLILGFSNISLNIEQALTGAQAVNHDMPIYGGVAGDDLSMKGSNVYTNYRQSSYGLVCLTLNMNAVRLESITNIDWQGMGNSKVITHSEGNVVHTLNDQPAVDVLKDCLGGYRSQLPEEELLGQWVISHPLELIRTEGASVIRAPLGIHKNTTSLFFNGNMPKGDRVKITFPPNSSAIDKAVSRAKKLYQDFPKADGLLLFSSKSRHLIFGSRLEEEFRCYQHIWQKPLAGLFVYGELGKSIDRQSFDVHNQTSILVLLQIL